MAYELIWSPTSRYDLRELRDYIAENDSTTARRFVQSVFDAVERLQDFPDSGRVVPEFEDSKLREVIKRPCRIIYRVKTESAEIEIARVWHSARGIPKV